MSLAETRKRVCFILALAPVASAVACASVPSVTFDDPEGGTIGGDGSVAGNDASIVDGAVSINDSAAPKDSGKKGVDAGDTTDGSVFPAPDAAACGGGAGDICCGADICHNCALSDCPTCTGLACNMGKICCAKSNNVTCHASGPGC